ncbi:MAG: biotin--[acetyl-CoA-carboxylase] ligase [Methanosphaera sp. rholeuAM130]|nr:biotin--[acetyl-CoA-carboxylase] ligase [Methanosphaera sp.]RAP54516.1 MAG: biotin--[acetyl-CoA-carboxylase] ligase [Methanosphaera sp. rholeuAM130]
MIRKHILKKIQEEYVTESELLEKLNITHENLKENLLKLKDAGYDIRFEDKKGYKLFSSPDIIEPFEIKRNLSTNYIAQNIHFYQEVTSTNDIAKKFVDNDAPEGTVIVAEQQTAGRSRSKNDWASPEGGIWMTLVVKPEVTLLEASKLTIVTGVAIAKTLHDHFNIHAGIKWPNDIMIGNKKVCGILTEAVTDYDELKAVLIGIGIDVNVNLSDLPDDLQNITTNVNEESNEDIKRAEIMDVFFTIFEEFYEEFKQGNFKHIISEWRRLSSTTGNRVKVYKDGKAIIADAVGIDNQGALIVELDDGSLEKIISGECKILDE